MRKVMLGVLAGLLGAVALAQAPWSGSTEEITFPMDVSVERGIDETTGEHFVRIKCGTHGRIRLFPNWPPFIYPGESESIKKRNNGLLFSHLIGMQPDGTIVVSAELGSDPNSMTLCLPETVVP